jgi:flagellar hook protein FlgE
MNPIGTAFSSVATPSAADSGRAAIAAGTSQLNRDAQQIAEPHNQDLAGPLTDSKQALLLTEAGAAVIRASDKMLGTLLDTLA